jgi:CBS-domain-containing membrane protein
MPIISDKIPGPCKSLRAGDIMAKDVVCLEAVDTISNIRKVLKTSHHAFPILNKQNKLIGIIPRNFILSIIRNYGWYSHLPLEDDGGEEDSEQNSRKSITGGNIESYKSKN